MTTMRQGRNGPTPRHVIGYAALAVTMAGGSVSCMGDDGLFNHMSVGEVKKFLDGVPRPPGAILVEETSEKGSGDRATGVFRKYRVTGDQPACSQLAAATAGSGWKLTDNAWRPLAADACDPSVPNDAYRDYPDNGKRAGYLLRADGSPGGVIVTWTRTELTYDAGEGEIP